MIAGSGRHARGTFPMGASGQGVVELGLVLAVAAVVAVVALVLFGPQLAAVLDLIGAQVQQPA